MNLNDIIVTPLRRIATSGGDVLHAMKCTDTGYNNFGEAYFSLISAGAVKAWKRHTKMTMNVVVPVGQVRFVFCELITDGVNAFRVEDIGEDSYARITVPPGIWFGFQGRSLDQSLILNIANIPHEPNEVDRMAQSNINYVWE